MYFYFYFPSSLLLAFLKSAAVLSSMLFPADVLVSRVLFTFCVTNLSHPTMPWSSPWTGLRLFSAPAGGGLFKGPARRACPVVVCGQGGCLSPLLRGWWPKVVVAPPVHVHVLVVQAGIFSAAALAQLPISHGPSRPHGLGRGF